MNYYNTNSERGATLKKSKAKAISQEQLILEMFKNNPRNYYSPDAVIRKLKLQHTPITSIRRAITNLTLKAKLVKTGDMVMGSYGKMVNTWKLK